MHFPNLDTFDVSEKELNPLAYNPSDFPTLQDMLKSPQFNSPKFESISLTALSVNGTIKQDTFEAYLAKKAVSSSALKEILKTPSHYRYYTEQKQKVPEKACFELGSFAHMAFIEPARFDSYIIEPDGSMAKKEDVLALIRFYEKTNGVAVSGVSHLGDDPKINDMKIYLASLKEKCPYLIVAKEYQEIIDALQYNYKYYGDGIIPRLLKGAVSEASFYSKDPSTRLPVKIRPDFLNIEENIGVNAIISFKTTSANTVEKFQNDSANFKYELSEGMYQDVASHVTGRKFNVTIMIMLQTVAPFLTAVFWWGPEDITNGKHKYRTAINDVKECQDKKLYPGFDAMAGKGNYGIIDFMQPEWAKKDLRPVDIED